MHIDPVTVDRDEGIRPEVIRAWQDQGLSGEDDLLKMVTMDRKETLPCATYLEGEYGITGTVLGVPVKVGRNGIGQDGVVERSPGEYFFGVFLVCRGTS